MRYAGGKGKAFQHVINLIPPHDTYIETHLGGGAVLRNMLPSKVSIGIDRDQRVVDMWRKRHSHMTAAIVHDDAVPFLRRFLFSGSEVVYCDPPYLPSTRSRKRVYRHDYEQRDHEELLELIRHLPCNVIISGYPSELYDSTLREWNTHVFQAKTHQGIRLEELWFNFPRPHVLHDSRYLGDTFRERELIRRRLARVQQRILSLTSPEQHALSRWLRTHTGGENA